MAVASPRRTRAKKPRNAAPAVRLHKATGQAYVLIQGTRHYCGKHDDPKAHERGLRMLADAAANGGRIPVDPAQVTVAEVVAAYLDYAREYHSGRTAYDAVKVAMAPLLDTYRSAPAASFGPLALKGLREQWIAAGLTTTTINRHTSAIKRCFRWAAAEQMIRPDVPAALECLENLRPGRCKAKPPRRVGPVDDAHVDAIRDYVSRQVWAIIELQRLTGARSGELLGLRAGNIDRSGEVWRVELAQHKSAHRGKSRAIHFGPKAQTILRPFLLCKRPEQTLFDPRDAESERAALAESHRRERQKPTPRETDRKIRDAYDTHSYGRAIARAIVEANKERAADAQIPHWHPHQLRHSAATKLRESAADMDSIAALLGHSEISMTQHYAALNRDRAAAIAAQFG